MRRTLVAFAMGAALVLGPATHAASTVTIVVDVSAGKQAISPLVYGWNGEASLDNPGSHLGGFAPTLAATRPGLVRIGGNRFTAFNWEKNYSNAGSDYLYENDDYLSSSTTAGAAVLGTVQAVKGIGGATLVTVPVGTYVAKDANGPVDIGSTVDTSRFLLNKPTGPLTTTPDKTDAYVYQNQFVDWLAHAVTGANVLYSLDNEPNDWSYTHQEVHPANLTYTELTSDDLTFAKAIKATYAHFGLAAPLVTGPALDGWQGQEDPDNNDGSSTDFQTYGRFIDYYLAHLKAADTAAGKRLIDVLDLHWYPQVSPDVYNLQHGADVVAAREQAPRSLWDTGYTENSWVAQYIGGPIKLIPRLQQEIAANDPGIGLGITEWNYGGGNDISGGIATADTLGIFGRYGMKLAAFWPQFQPDENFAFGAFEMFRNFDGNGAAFGDTEVSATDSDRVNTSAYASIASANPKHAVIVLINKNLKATTATVQLAHYVSTGHAKVYTLTSASSDPQAAATITATSANTFTYSMPAQSVSVIVPTPAAATPAFYADTPPAATRTLPYSYTFGATGTPAPTYAVASGTLPAGLTFSTSTGVLSGTPTTNGTSMFTIRASNTAGTATTPTLSIAVTTGAAPVLTADAPPGGAWEGNYAYMFKASGNPAPTFAVASGALPPGLALGPHGSLAGAPTTIGTYSFAITASNGIAPAGVSGTLSIHVAGPATGTVLAWGDNSTGQLGPGNRVSAALPAPVPLPGGAKAVQVAAGDGHGLALTAGGVVYAWGNNTCGELGNATDNGCNGDLVTPSPVRVQFPGGTPAIVAVAAGVEDGLALDANGDVWAWGDDGVGELGDGNTETWQNVPVKVSLGGHAGHVVAIAADAHSSAALTDGGNVLTWGSGERGALGNGGTADSDVPVTVSLGGAAGTIASIAAGGPQAGHVIALTTGQTIVGWGNNEQGQVGDGTVANRPTPVAAGPSSVLAIGAANYDSFAQTNDGKTWAWGNNGFGELGTGTASDHEATPVQVLAGLPALAMVTGGDFYSFALTTTGTLYAFGEGDHGELGDGTLDGKATPAKTKLPFGKRLGSVSAGLHFGLGIVGTPAPLISRVTPYRGTASGGSLLIAGSGFTPGATVRIGSTTVKPTFLSATELLVSTTATGDVTVTTAAGTSPDTPGARAS
jgi:alpha-tubulin suppressor-like RCC1 family protein